MKHVLSLSVVALALVACSSTKVVMVNDAGAPASSGGAGTQCTSARTQLLAPIASTSTAQVKIVAQTATKTTLYIDASAGGIDQAPKNPRVYITLDGMRVDVSDSDAPGVATWDLALKRQVIFTNSGDMGVGQGGGVLVQKAFELVTAADGASVAPEAVFDSDCNAMVDDISDPKTSFTGWYDYDISTNRASPKAGVSFVVRSATGTTLYAIAIRSYTGRPDGSATAPATGFFLFDIKTL